MLGDFNSAARMKEAMYKIARSATADAISPPRAATVTAVDYTARTATVQYPDEGGTFVVAITSVAPVVGSVVSVAGPSGTRYVAEVLSGAVMLPNRTNGSGAPGGTGNNGDEYYDTAADRLYLSDGAGWIIMYEPEQTYTVTLTNITLGNGSRVGKYKRSNGRCKGKVWFQLGSTSAIGTNPQLRLPVAGSQSGTSFYDFDDTPAMYYDNTGLRNYGSCYSASNIDLAFVAFSTTGTYAVHAVLDANTPFVWAVSDHIFVAFDYLMSTPYL